MLRPGHLIKMTSSTSSVRTLAVLVLLCGSACPPPTVKSDEPSPVSLIIDMSTKHSLYHDDVVGKSEHFVQERTHSYQVFVESQPGMLTCSLAAANQEVTLTLEPVPPTEYASKSVGPACTESANVTGMARTVRCPTGVHRKYLVHVSLAKGQPAAAYRLSCFVEQQAAAASEVDAGVAPKPAPRPAVPRPKKTFKAHVQRSQKNRGAWDVTLDTCGMAGPGNKARLLKVGAVEVLSVSPCIVRLTDVPTPPAIDAEVQIVVDSGTPK